MMLGTLQVFARGMVLLVFAATPARAVEAEALRDVMASHDRLAREQAIASLRSEGMAGLDRALTLADALPPADRPQAEAFVDAVAGQRYASASQLFWYTDLDQAMARAQDEGKPILSLALLGRLDEEFSCANSRFFRAALYPDAAVSAFLREHFVLHWRTVREVPKITVDFGEGRRLQSTITGNSVHYILTADSRPIDVIPGLYGPKPWLALAQAAHAAATAYTEVRQKQGPEAAQQGLQAWHVQRRVEQIQSLDAEAARTISLWLMENAAGQGPSLDDDLETPQGPTGESIAQLHVATDEIPKLPAGQTPSARLAAPIAPTKAVSQASLLRPTAPGRSARTAEEGLALLWQRLAAQRDEDGRLDAGSLAVIGRLYAGEEWSAAEREAMIVAFQASLIEDGLRNEYLRHARVHAWFAAGEPTSDLSALNRRVYAELFLSPLDDPWLGMRSDAVFNGLQNGGLHYGNTPP